MTTVPPEHNLTLADRRERGEARDRLVTNLAAQWHLPNPILREGERDERQAAALARSWGFEGSAADPEFCAEMARMAAMRAPRGRW